MTPTPTPPKDAAPPPKRAYRPPQLVVLGNLKDLTGKHTSPGDSKGREGIAG